MTAYLNHLYRGVQHQALPERRAIQRLPIGLAYGCLGWTLTNSACFLSIFFTVDIISMSLKNVTI